MTNSLLLYGTRSIIEAIQAGKNIDKVFIQKGVQNKLTTQLIAIIHKNGISISFVPIEKLNKLTQKNHQGAVAYITPISFISHETLIDQLVNTNKPALLVLLDQVSDTRNFGAIIRTANCTGVHGIIIPNNGAAPVNGDTIKTSAGALFEVPICKVAHLKDAIYYLQANDIQIIAASEKSKTSLYDIDFKKPTALVMGSEGRGVSPGILKIVDQQARLPIQGSIASLNVSVACGAFLYEIIRQRL